METKQSRCGRGSGFTVSFPEQTSTLGHGTEHLYPERRQQPWTFVCRPECVGNQLGLQRVGCRFARGVLHAVQLCRYYFLTRLRLAGWNLVGYLSRFNKRRGHATQAMSPPRGNTNRK
jgi:hypothetical protein